MYIKFLLFRTDRIITKVPTCWIYGFFVSSVKYKLVEFVEFHPKVKFKNN